jgi:CheY-like chemotaxis protein
MLNKVYLVSNDNDSIKSLEHYCSALNLTCTSLEPADDLFFSLRKNKPDLLIIDFILNDINGGSLCHQLKCDPVFHDLPVALLTEYNSLESIAPKFGCGYLLAKPLTLNHFLLLVKKVTNMELHNL